MSDFHFPVTSESSVISKYVAIHILGFRAITPVNCFVFFFCLMGCGTEIFISKVLILLPISEFPNIIKGGSCAFKFFYLYKTYIACDVNRGQR